MDSWHGMVDILVQFFCVFFHFKREQLDFFCFSRSWFYSQHCHVCQLNRLNKCSQKLCVTATKPATVQNTVSRVVGPTTTPDRNFCPGISVIHHASTLSSSHDSKIWALCAMFWRSHGGQRGGGGRRKQRKISVIIGVQEQLPAGQAWPSSHQPHSSLCSLKEPAISVPTTPITPDETKMKPAVTSRDVVSLTSMQRDITNVFSVCVFNTQSAQEKNVLKFSSSLATNALTSCF